jgi:hypothetical protein
LRRAYEIIQDELEDEHIDKEMMLQMAVKAINDSAGPDGIVLTLLVFGAYSRLTEMDPPSPSVTKRAEAIYAATKEVRRLYAERRVKDALAMRNGPDTKNILDLPLQSDVRVWREKEGWTGPYKLIATEEETCTIDMPRGPAKFRSTAVKPYFTEQARQEELRVPEEPQETRRGRGRPKGSRNIRRPENNELRRSERHITAKHNNQFITAMEEDNVSMTFLTRKEQADMELSVKL